MRSRIICLALIIMVVFSVNKTWAQKDITIYYEMTVESDDEFVKAMVGNQKMMIRSQGDNFKMVQKSDYMSTSQIINTKKEKGLMLVNNGLDFIAIPIQGDEYTKLVGEQDNQEVRKTDQTKVIHGYNCKQAFLVDSNGQETEIWYAPEITLAVKNSQLVPKGIDGTVLETISAAKGVKVILRAVKVDDSKIDKSHFSMKIPEGYTEMTWSEYVDWMNDY